VGGRHGAERFIVSRPDVVASTVDGEVVAINLATGSYYNIAGSGTAVWATVDQVASTDEVIARLAHRYEQPVEKIAEAVTPFMDELLAEGLIRPAGDAQTGQRADDPLSEVDSAFSPPVLEKFTDMEDLLLVDPVHDVSERGWPHVEAD
jgi:hypothetical protein